ncbi:MULTISPECIES: preprotein translocase subunit YajC [unclassified Amycolatopsis]|uniref:preprotein translocase subunit YajC n=1 Tax=unclassified Amycolatopsis TaxID=2618356 RepID=UPI001FF59D58|nr:MULTISPECIES: preprotein translocase subunit YajC [unclassified Amycolatopsis]UOZ04843.1 preprotein translocase subunit YajC [Amycolatopsis sp. WQ 127309]WSJ80321.1 preprotein translocase subunit YajC [Amycolatopsis sp. NBC_01307]WSK76197.1 preprotein translocase subunit YajC [Amycolatopsis sp. NBC_01286]
MQNLLLPLLLVLVLAVPLVMSSRKQKKQQAAQQDLQSSLAPGDRVMTTSGLYGTVADTSGDNTIDIEIAPGVVTTWLRLAVREKVEPVVETDETPADELSSDAPAEESIIESGSGIKDDEPATTAQVAPPLEHGKK